MEEEQGEGKGTALGKLSQGVDLPREGREVWQGEEGGKDFLYLDPQLQLPGLQAHRPVRLSCSPDHSVRRRGREMGWPQCLIQQENKGTFCRETTPIAA